MKKLLFVLPIVALGLFALPAVSHAQGNINPGNTESEPLPADSSGQGGSSQSQGN